MTAARTVPLLRHLHRLAAGRAAALPDGELLRWYVERREETAFVALVERHGPMVLGVCQSVLRHRHDAEDTFQATFLLLARNAASIRRAEGVGSWLHGVAYRVALKARAAAARRRAIESRATPPQPVAPADDLSWGEVRALLHAELTALPSHLREPLVLCYLEGLTQDEAAQRLGWSAATLKGRLQRGREKLRRRLERRGLGLAAVLGATALAGKSFATPLPSTLVATAVEAARPDRMNALAAASLARGLLSSRVCLIAAACLTTALLAAGLAYFSRQPEPPPAAAKPTESAAPVTDLHGDTLPDGAVARLGTVRFNHGEQLNALFYSPDGKFVYSQGNGLLYRWDADTGKELNRFALGPSSWSDDELVLAADGKTLTLLRQEFAGDTLATWDLAQGKEVRRVALPVGRRSELSVYRRNTLSRDGRLAAVHMPKVVKLYDLATPKELYQLGKGGDEIDVIVFAANDRLVTADKKQTIDVWEARAGKLLRSFPNGCLVTGMSASADGSRLATLFHDNHSPEQASERDNVRVWDLAAGTRKYTLTAPAGQWYHGAQFTPNGKYLLVASSGLDGLSTMLVCDAETGQRVRELKDAGTAIFAISPDSNHVVGGGHGKFELWDLRNGQRLSTLDSRLAQAASLYLSPTGDRVYTGGYDAMTTWDGTTGRRVRSFELPPYPYSDPHRVHSADGRLVVSFAGELKQSEIIIWDAEEGRRLHTLRPPANYYPSNCAFSPDAALLATWHSGEESVVYLWDVRTGKEIRSIPAKKAGWPGGLFFTPDGKALFLAGNRTIGVDVATGKELFSWRLEPVKDDSGGVIAVGGKPLDPNERRAWRSLTMSPDRTLAVCILDGGWDRKRLDNRIVLCEARTGRVLYRWNDSGLPSAGWEQVVFSPDNRLLASSDGMVVHVWEVATGKEVRSFSGHRGEVCALAFSGNGRRLASGSWDKTVLVWDLTRGAGSPKEIAVSWADLAGDDANRGYAAIWRLANTPAESVPYLRERLRPVTEAQSKEIAALVIDLDSDDFAKRAEASGRLEKLGVDAAPALRQALEKNPSPELRRRVEQLLERLDGQPLSGEALRTERALAVLEQAGTAEARNLVVTLAGGAPNAWLTRQARAAVGRTAR